MNKLLLLVFFVFISITSIFSQPLTGIRTINPDGSGSTNYKTFTAAINDLNSRGAVNNLTFRVSRGKTFNENPPAISFVGGTFGANVIFEATGIGANPKIIPNTVGTKSSTTFGDDGDAIIKIIGSDSITFNSIDLLDNSSFSNSTEKMEYGFYLTKTNDTNACKNIKIMNCNITLDKSVIISSGIYVSNISGTTNLTVTSIDGRSEDIFISGNAITNVNTGIQLRGYDALYPYNFYDENIIVTDNTVSNYGGTSSAHGVYSIFQNNLEISDNTFLGNSSGNIYGILSSSATNSSININGNVISDTTTGGILYGIYNEAGALGTIGTPTNLINISNNVIQNCYSTASSSDVYLLVNNSDVDSLKIQSNKIKYNTSIGSGNFYGIIQNGKIKSYCEISNDTVVVNTRTSLSSTNSVYGIISKSISILKNNLIDSLSCSSGSLAGIVTNANTSTAGSKQNIFSNTIRGLINSSGSGTAYGFYTFGSNQVLNIYNNFISDFSTPASNNTEAIAGMKITVGDSVYVFNNTIYLNALSSATTFGTSGVSVISAVYLDMRSNIIVNTSTPKGLGGFTAAYRRSSNDLTKYSNNSNNNLFYAGTPSVRNLIFYNSITGDQTLASYKLRVTPRDSASVTELPPFVNNSTLPYDLKLKTNIPTQCESGGQIISIPLNISTDFFSEPRYPNTGYPEDSLYLATAPDIGADEFGGINLDSSLKAIGTNIFAIMYGYYNESTNKLNIKDTLTVYLRDTSSSTSYRIIDSAKGTIDSVTFMGNFNFINAPSGRYYIILKHRNGLETWNYFGGVSLYKGSTITYDFSEQNWRSYGSSTIQNEDLQWCIGNSDVNQDLIVDGVDLSIVEAAVNEFKEGYQIEDINGDGIVDASDLSLTEMFVNLFLEARKP